MNIKKSRPRRQPGTGRTETAAYGRAAISCDYYTTPTAERQTGLIADLLLYGAENAISRRELIALTGDSQIGNCGG